MRYYSDKILNTDRVQFFFFKPTWEIISLFFRRGYSWYKNDDLKIIIIKTRSTERSKSITQVDIRLMYSGFMSTKRCASVVNLDPRRSQLGSRLTLAIKNVIWHFEVELLDVLWPRSLKQNTINNGAVDPSKSEPPFEGQFLLAYTCTASIT